MKNKVKVKDIVNVIKLYAYRTKAEVEYQDGKVMVYLSSSPTDPLILDLTNEKVNGFFHWRDLPEERFYEMLDIFVEIKPFFRSLYVDDDEGACQAYLARRNPCRVNLAQLSKKDDILLSSLRGAKEMPLLRKIEQDILKNSGFSVNSCGITQLIIYDFIKIMSLGEAKELDPEAVIAEVGRINFFAEKHDPRLYVDGIGYYLPYFILEIWLSHKFTFKRMGLIKDIPSETRGLLASKIAALNCIANSFLNFETMGESSAKEKQLHTFMRKYSDVPELGDTADEFERDVVLIKSIFEYLNIEYVGADTSVEADR